MQEVNIIGSFDETGGVKKGWGERLISSIPLEPDGFISLADVYEKYPLLLNLERDLGWWSGGLSMNVP